MTAYAPTRRAASMLPLVIFIMLAVLAMVAVQSAHTAQSHAVAKHGVSLATHARLCNQQGNVNQVWQSTPRKSFAEICELNTLDMMDDEKTWTVRIIDKISGQEITVFRHTGDMVSLEEYMTRALYIVIGG